MSPQGPERIVVRRYPGDRIYYADEHRYVTVDELRSWAAEGRNVTVIDAETGLDVARTLLS